MNIKVTSLDSLIDSLTIRGERLIRDAYDKRNRDFTTRTGNLRDSYGSAVYLRGELIEKSIRTLSPIAQQRRNGLSGAEEIQSFLREYRPNGGGLTLVVASTMPYSSILEEGGGNLSRSYRVIRGIEDKMQVIAKEYKGTWSYKKIS